MGGATEGKGGVGLQRAREECGSRGQGRGDATEGGATEGKGGVGYTVKQATFVVVLCCAMLWCGVQRRGREQ